MEGTILDGEKPRSATLLDDELGDLGGGGGGEEKRRRSSKKDPSSHRHSRYTTGRDVDPDMIDDRRASRRKESRRSAAVAIEREEVGGGVRSGSGSGGDFVDNNRTSKHRSRRRETGGYTEEYDAYADGGPAVGRTFDGRPSNPKRNSILGRLGGMF